MVVYLRSVMRMVVMVMVMVVVMVVVVRVGARERRGGMTDQFEHVALAHVSVVSVQEDHHESHIAVVQRHLYPNIKSSAKK